MVDKSNKPKAKRKPQSERKHIRRLKQEERKTAVVVNKAL